MFFSNLNKEENLKKFSNPNLRQAVFELQKDEGFLERFWNDSELDKLEQEKFDPALCWREFEIFFGNPLIVKPTSEKFKNITLSQYCWLWGAGNKVVNRHPNEKDFDIEDVDLFLYVLDNWPEPVEQPIYEIVRKSIDYSSKKYGDYSLDELKNIIKYICSLGFSALDCLPSVGNKQACDSIPCFDVDWMTGMICKVHSVTGLTPSQICDTPLNTVCHYYVQWYKQNSSHPVDKRTSQEILEAISKRTDILVADYLVEKGILKKEEREVFLKVIGEETNG